MNPTRACPKCAAPLPADAPAGHCPHCLLSLALAAQPGPDTAAALEQATLDSGTAASGTSGTGTVRLTSPTEQPGDTIGRYKLLQKVGEGGCGIVYMAEQSEPVRRKVALKVIKLGMDTKAVMARFDAERQALAMMDHPNIAKVLDAGATDAGRPYFVMELVRGIPITKYCDENSLPTAERLNLFTQVCSAIQHAHQKGIIHRDIKPSNILVTLHDGVPVPKVIDFGIAKATEARLTDLTLFTELHAFVGTPAYMSPEQAEMSGLDMDTRADIYSLGVLLYELLSGKLPFDPETLLKAGLDEMRRTIREVEPPRPSTRLLDLVAADVRRVQSTPPPTSRAEEETRASSRRLLQRQEELAARLRGDLDWIVMKALEKDRTRRYESASAFAQDIKRYLGNEAVLACPPSAVYRLRKLARRHRAAAFVTMFVLVTLALVLPNHFIGHFRLKQARARANAEAARAREAEQAARAVKEFLQNDLLRQVEGREQARQGFTPEPNLTLRAALERAAARMGDRFRYQPLVEAEIRRTLGLAYTRIGEVNRAIEQFERAVARRRVGERELGPDHPDTLDCLIHLGYAYRDAKRNDEAIAVLTQVLKLRREKLAETHPDVASSLQDLATVYGEAGRHLEAVPLMERCLQLRRATLGSQHPETLVAMSDLAAACSQVGRHDECLRLLGEAIQTSRTAFGADDPRTLYFLNVQAIAFERAGRKDEAIALYEETLRLRRARLGASHRSTLTSLNNLALAYQSAGRADAAAGLFEEVLRLRRGNGDDVTDALRNLALARVRAGRRAEAQALFEEAVRLQELQLGLRHPDTQATLGQLVSLLDAWDRAEPGTGKAAQAAAWRQKLVAK
jgi:eukaryotic-like serine/threonine-protein kinase